MTKNEARLLCLCLLGCLAAGPGCSDDGSGDGGDPCYEVFCGDHGECDPQTGQCDCEEGFAPSGDGCVSAVVADFEDLDLQPDSYWNGSDETGSFRTGDATFLNYYESEYDYWEGFAYSNMTDTETPGYENQYSAVAGQGARGSELYGVGYYSTFYGNPPPTVTLPNGGEGVELAGAYVTNTTYAYLAMRDGDAVAKKFGGPTGEDPDWFLLSIHGVTAEREVVGPVEVYLADFRFSDSAEDYIVEDWTWVDLSGLGPVVAIELTISSSDSGEHGINTPAYFAIDDITRASSNSG